MLQVNNPPSKEKYLKMKNFLQVHGEEVVTPPEIISLDLGFRFNNPINIEWSKKGGLYEAIFYCESTEHIADYKSDGALISYRVNITPPVLPDDLIQIVDPDYEIMNIVKRVSADDLTTYEIVARDKELNRYLVNIDSAKSSVETRSL